MKIQIFLILFLSFSIQIFAQDELKVFKTFENYQDNEGLIYKGDIIYFGFVNLFGKRELTFKDKNAKKEEKKINIDCHNVWGFSFNNILYKMIKTSKKPYPMCVVAQNDLIYFENGIGHLSASRNFKHFGKYFGELPTDYDWGSLVAISKNINAAPVALKSLNIKDRKQSKKFKVDNPQFNDFFDCITWNMALKKIRKCYFSYFKNSPPPTVEGY